MTEQEFRTACLDRGIKLSDDQMQQFRTYTDLLIEWNEKMNLTAITEPSQIWEKHFLDSILPFADIDIRTLADIGTGAGFPGIPVKITWPDIQVTLVEPLKKRCRFLEVVKDSLQLQGLEIVPERAEEFAADHRDCFDAVCSRAVARLSILLELTAPLARPGGLIIALKGPGAQDELAAAAPALKALHLKLIRETDTSLEAGNRVNLYFEKQGLSDRRYPRNFGQIKKHPLEDDAWQK